MPKPASRKRLILLLIILVPAVLFRLVKLDAIPLSEDELHYVADSLAAEEFQSYPHQRDLLCFGAKVESRIAHPFLYPQLNYYIIFPLFGRNFYTARLLSALAGFLSVLVIYFIVYELKNKDHGLSLLAMAMLAFSPFHIRFSRSAYLDSLFFLLLLLSVLFLWRTLKYRQSTNPLLLGIFIALMSSVKISAFLPLLAILFFILYWHLKGFKKPPVHHYLLALIAFLVFFLVENNPRDYLRALLIPNDPRLKMPLPDYILHLLDKLGWYFNVMLYLAPLSLILLFPFTLKVFRSPAPPVFLAIFLFFFLAPLLFVHSPPLSGEHGLLPFLLPLILFAVQALDFCQNPLKRVILIFYFALSLTESILFGLPIASLPYKPYYNMTVWNTPEYQALNYFSRRLPPDSRLATNFITIQTMRNWRLFLPQALFLIEDFSKTEGEQNKLQLFDFMLLDSASLKKEKILNFKFIEKRIYSNNEYYLYQNLTPLPRLIPLSFFTMNQIGTDLYSFSLPDYIWFISAKPELFFTDRALEFTPRIENLIPNKNFSLYRAKQIKIFLSLTDVKDVHYIYLKFVKPNPLSIYVHSPYF